MPCGAPGKIFSVEPDFDRVFFTDINIVHRESPFLWTLHDEAELLARPAGVVEACAGKLNGLLAGEKFPLPSSCLRYQLHLNRGMG